MELKINSKKGLKGLLFCFLSDIFIEFYKRLLFTQKHFPTSSNYGLTGLIETPNARMMPEASLRLSFSSSFPNEFTTLTATPFSWLEATYRYVN